MPINMYFIKIIIQIEVVGWVSKIWMFFEKALGCLVLAISAGKDAILDVEDHC